MLLVPSLCDDPPNDVPSTLPPTPDLGSPEEFLKEVNEYRAKLAKEHRVPNMYKLVWSNEFVEKLNPKSNAAKLMDSFREFTIHSYRNPAGFIDSKFGKFKNLSEILMNLSKIGYPVELINPLQTFIGCTPIWNESLVEILEPLDLQVGLVHSIFFGFLSSNDSSWEGFGKHWRITDKLPSFSAAVVAINEAVYAELFDQKLPWDDQKLLIRGKEESTAVEELVHPLQTSIGCMKKEVDSYGRKIIMTPCLLGNMGQWPSDWKLDVNSKKIPGSECMDGYVNDDGLCSIPLPTTTSNPVPSVPKKPEVTAAPAKKPEAMESEQEEEESSSTTKLSYGLWIIYLFLFFF
ncbi:hypothetical protein CAEBREN_22884 [Caenorhabditis brenneri]|uniref:Uncharacterized protein n=1 Tax=Caenorhabditis brenneri TaxID=135651 RepID=G0MVV0_CAEBE|nr:hypothetical protein CAEBREN_22884 [Caenorhabditis brenneri]